MEEEVKTWREVLEGLQKGKSAGLEPGDSPQSVYSAIRENVELFKGKKFSVRTHPISKKQRVYRIK